MVMTVECPSCASSFPVDPRKIPEGGVNARCTSCSEVFRVERPPEEEPAPEAAIDTATEAEAAEASMPGVRPASQGDTESLVEPAEPELDGETEPETGLDPEEEPREEAFAPAEEEADEGDPSPDGDWQSWSAPVAEVDEEIEEAEEEDEEPGAGMSGFGEIETAEPDTPTDEGDAWAVESKESPGLGTVEVEPEPEVADEPGAAQPAPEMPAVEEPELGGPVVDEAADVEVDTPEETVDGPSDEPEPAEAGGFGSDGGMAPPASMMDSAQEADLETEEERQAEAPEMPPPSEPVQGFSFGQRDPSDKARRLARVLVSDMIMYNPERHQRALENDTLKADFEEEIEKSWKEYVEQVGEEMAESTDFWTAALNDILAKGQEVF